MKMVFLVAVAVASFGQYSFAAPSCKAKIEKAAIDRCNDDCFVETAAKFIRSTRTGKDEYIVSVANAGTSFEETYAVYTQTGTCQITDLVLIDHE